MYVIVAYGDLQFSLVFILRAPLLTPNTYAWWLRRQGTQLSADHPNQSAHPPPEKDTTNDLFLYGRDCPWIIDQIGLFLRLGM